MERALGIGPTSEAWELSETATYAPVSVRTNMSIRKERYWLLRNRELVHGAKMYVMPQLGVRISWRERCKPGPRHQFCFFFAAAIPFRPSRLNLYLGSNLASATRTKFFQRPCFSKLRVKRHAHDGSSHLIPGASSVRDDCCLFAVGNRYFGRSFAAFRA
jgi:hypothetical protein